MTCSEVRSTTVSTPPLIRAHSWPPSQWCLDQYINFPDSPISSPSSHVKEISVINTVRPAPVDITPKRNNFHEATSDQELQEESESESVKAASITAIFPTSNNPSRNNLLSAQKRGPFSDDSSTSSRSKLAISTSPQDRKASFRDRHLKKWSQEMSRTSKRMARALRLPRKNKDTSKSPEKQIEPPLEERRKRSRSKTEVRNPPHEMSLDVEEPVFILPVPPPPPLKAAEGRSNDGADSYNRGRTIDIPRRDLMDLNGGIRAAAGMPHQMRKRHASGKRRASREPERTLHDIKEEWNISQIHREAWAARVNANPPGSPSRWRMRAASDSSVPSSLLTT